MGQVLCSLFVRWFVKGSVLICWGSFGCISLDDSWGLAIWHRDLKDPDRVSSKISGRFHQTAGTIRVPHFGVLITVYLIYSWKIDKNSLLATDLSVADNLYPSGILISVYLSSYYILYFHHATLPI